MSGRCSTLSNDTSDADNNICPECNQPLPSSGDDAISSYSTPGPKRAYQQSDSSSKSTSSYKRHKGIRSSSATPTGQFTRVWDSRPHYPVMVNAFIDKEGKEKKWLPGIVNCVHDDDDGNYRISVMVEDENEGWVLPSTINSQNCDPIPNVMKNDPTYKLSNYIRSRDESLDGLSIVGMKQMKCINYHTTGRASSVSEEIPEQDSIGKALLSDDPESQKSMRNILHSLMVNENVKQVVKVATGEDTCSSQYALAYFVGQLCGIELSEVSDDLDPKSMLDRLGSRNHSIDCPISQVFLTSVMTARTLKTKEIDPNVSLYDSRAKAVLSDPEKLKVRLGRLRTALAAMHSSQTDQPSVHGPSFAHLEHGIHLMMDMRGTSDKLLDSLSNDAVCRPATVLRHWIKKLSDAIDPLNARTPPPPGESYVTATTADNADYHLYHNCVSVVPVGNVLLCTEPAEDSIYFNENYMKGLASVSSVEPTDLVATKEEDDIAQHVIDIQNIVALLTAFVEHDTISDCSASDTSPHSPVRPSIGSDVKFLYRSKEREGTVKETSPRNVVVEFTDGGITVRRTVALDNILDNISAATSSPANTTETAESVDIHIPPEHSSQQMFDGERHRFPPTTTSIESVITGLSSKNDETARQVIHNMISTHGKESFHKAVHPVVVDQEFIPTMFHEFFSRLKTDDELPIMPALAIGHAMKGLSVSMMSYYQCYFDPILESMGVKIGSPEYNRYYKGSEIRATNDLVANFTEMLATAAAHRYLSEKGDENRIEISGHMVSPNTVIKTYFVADENDQTTRSEVAMDPNMRPMSISVTDSLLSLARDFQKWARHKWGTTKRDEVGPSGYVRTEDVEQEVDPAQQELSLLIERDTTNYPRYQALKYFDEGDTDGLLTRCTKAGILGKSSRRDKDTLQKKLYLLEVRQNKEAAITFGPARKVPAGTNSSGLVVYDIIFGVERLAIVYGHLLTRVRPKDTVKRKGKRVERYPREWLVFFKALTVSTFMRGQPNYQRLTLAFLIQLSLILKHDDPRCTDLALRRLRSTMSVSESGDSHKCYPVDLLQEHSLVQVTKQVGGRNPTATNLLQDRVKLKGYLRLLHIESRANAEFDQISPSSAVRARYQHRRAISTAVFWVGILGAIGEGTHDVNAIEGLGSEESQVLFVDRSRAILRSNDAVGHVLESGAAFLKGYVNHFEVALPPRRYPILRCLHRTKKKRKISEQSLLASAAKKCKMEAEQSLTSDGYVTVNSSSSILDGISNAGDGKSKIFPAVISTMSHNRQYKKEDGDGKIGPDVSGRPVILTRTVGDATNYVKQRSKRGDNKYAPVMRIIDVAKDLYGFIPKRGAGLPNTVQELARDFIDEMINRYYYHGIEMICLTMDVTREMTSLRAIPHKKRGKLESTTAHHGTLSRVKKDTDDLTPHGTRFELLRCGDQHFTELLFDTVCNECKSLQDGDWVLHRETWPFALAMVGGSSQACVVVGIGGKEHIRLNTESISVTCQELENELETRKIVQSEEGEMMMYAAMTAILRMGFTHDNSCNHSIDCIVELHSDDSDAFAGMSMQSIFNLESTCQMRKKRFTGSIYLRCSRKSVKQVAKLGNVFKTNVGVDPQLCPTGRGFIFTLDVISVYYTLEQDDSLPKFPPGHRAICLVAVVYTLLNHDYLSVAKNGGLTYSKLIAAMKSVSYNNEIKRFDTTEMISPINMHRKAVFVDQHHNNDQGYNLPGVVLLLHHAFINRQATKNLLLSGNKYTQEDLSKQFPYDTVRAISILAEELQPLPDLIALLAHLSCANLIFRRWSFHLYNKKRRTDDELESTCYMESDVKGEKTMSVEYNLWHVAKVYRESWDDRTLISKMRTTCYGSLLPLIRHEANDSLPVNILNAIRAALRHQGFYPSVKVSADSLPPLPPTAQPPTLPPDHNEEDDDDGDCNVPDEGQSSDDESTSDSQHAGENDNPDEGGLEDIDY